MWLVCPSPQVIKSWQGSPQLWGAHMAGQPMTKGSLQGHQGPTKLDPLLLQVVHMAGHPCGLPMTKCTAAMGYLTTWGTCSHGMPSHVGDLWLWLPLPRRPPVAMGCPTIHQPVALPHSSSPWMGCYTDYFVSIP